MRSISIAAATALIMLFVYGCSSSSKSTPPGDDHTKELKKIDSLITTQSDYSDSLNSLFTHLDSTAAKDSLVKILLADPNVQTAQSNSQGILVQYTNGMRGGILLNPEDGEDAAGLSPQYKLGSALGGDPGPGHKPSSKKTIFLNPSYWERQAWADPLTATADAAFAKTEYNAFEKYVNAQCTIDKFTSLSGYGIVHIYTHGIAWPSKNNIQEVYMLTGETASQATSDKYFADIKAGKIPIVVYASGNKYCISPSFFARHNNFSDDTTLIYGGFCYSGLGGWKDTLIQVAKAGAYVGFDWHVLTSMNSAWARHLYSHMGDTSASAPMTIGEWQSADPDTGNTYFDNEATCQKWVTVWNYGYADLVLWRALKILSIDPPAAQVGVQVKVRGSGFGKTKGTSTITFGGIIATPTTWSDTLIVTAVPQGTTGGPVIVTVGENHSNSFPFNLAVVSISIDVDTVHMLPYDTMTFRATVTGTADTAVNWEVLEKQPTSAGWFSSTYTNPTRFQVSNIFVGICHVVATSHADPTKKDTVTVVVSLMDRLRQIPYINCRFDGKMNYDITCTQATYTLATAFLIWNRTSLGMPVIHWEGNHFTIDGEISWNSTPWIYHEKLVVSGTLSPFGDTLLTCTMDYREWGNDPYYREWSHSVEVANVPLSSFTIVGNNNQLNFEVEGLEVPNYLTKFEDYYYETAANGSCLYERTATTADWSSNNPEANLLIQFDIRTFSMPRISDDSATVRQRGGSTSEK
jgi:hypothetical protein